MNSNDPTQDLYKLMNEAGLDAPNMFNSRKSMSRIVSEIRTDLAMRLKSYITRRDHEMFNAGKHASDPKKIEVKDE